MFAATAAVVLALRIGMPAEAAVSLLEGATPAPQNTRTCAEWYGERDGRVFWLMAEDGLVTSFDLSGAPGGPLTAAGLRLGDAVYGRPVTPGLRYELTPEGRVTAIRGGKSAQGLIEGCEWGP